MISYTSFDSLVRGYAIFLWLAVLIVHCGGANAQSPAGSPVRVNPTHDAPHLLDNIAMTPDGRLFVAWEAGSLLNPPLNSPLMLLLREYPPEGIATQPFVVHREKLFVCCHFARLATNDSGKLVVIFNRWSWVGFSARRYGFSTGPRAFWVDTTHAYMQAPEGVALDAAGGFVAVWISRGQEITDLEDLDEGLFARRYDSEGRAVGPEFHVNTFRRGAQILSAIAVSKSTGDFVIVWQSSDQDGSGWGIYGQRFGADGQRLGGEFLIPTQTEGNQTNPSVAMDQAGNFVVAWIGQDPLNIVRSAVFAQRFSSTGERLGRELRVSDEEIPDFENRSKISVSTDPQGNFIVSWTHWDGGFSMARLYRADGTPVRGPVPLTQPFDPFRDNIRAQVAFAANGTFGAAWTGLVLSDHIEDVYTQRFSASPGNEICMSRPNEFVCDTGRTGGAPEVRYDFGGAVGEPGLLGDVDGDGRDDACFYRKGVFFCDTEHNFGAAETKIRFGQSGDTPLLGDLDHDGKADPCFYRAGRFFCDTAHDGFAAEAEIAFGGPGDLPLLGDVDGDGRADPCVYRAGQFLCDTAHDGGGAEIQIAFGQAGDRPLLGDFDGDGRADPCVYRSGQFLCDTAHNGGAAEAAITFGEGNGVPMLGDLDGL